MFQIIMNKILRDLTNTGKVASFIDSVSIEIKEEEYDKIVKRVLRKLAENNLCIKYK